MCVCVCTHGIGAHTPARTHIHEHTHDRHSGATDNHVLVHQSTPPVPLLCVCVCVWGLGRGLISDNANAGRARACFGVFPTPLETRRTVCLDSIWQIDCVLCVAYGAPKVFSTKTYRWCTKHPQYTFGAPNVPVVHQIDTTTKRHQAYHPSTT
jgi:hypothetical protein